MVQCSLRQTAGGGALLHSLPMTQTGPPPPESPSRVPDPRGAVAGWTVSLGPPEAHSHGNHLPRPPPSPSKPAGAGQDRGPRRRPRPHLWNLWAGSLSGERSFAGVAGHLEMER